MLLRSDVAVRQNEEKFGHLAWKLISGSAVGDLKTTESNHHQIRAKKNQATKSNKTQTKWYIADKLFT